MHSPARHLLTLGTSMLTIAAAAATPAVALAQGTLQPVRVTAQAVSRADRLRIDAEVLPTRLDQFAKAARLYEQSAAARAPGDTATGTCLRTAAFLRYYSGDSRAGTALMEKAARNAAAFGDVALAANAYIDAAIIAVDAAQSDRALDLGRRAEQLARSPSLTDAERNALAGRMAGWHEVALALKQ
jgi:hypothetical protein